MITYIAAPFGNYLHTPYTVSVRGSYTLDKRKGLLLQLLKTLRYKDGSWYNALGLRNPGIYHGLKKYQKHKYELLSIAAVDQDDWYKLSTIIPPYVDLELNLSCPNIAHFENYTKDIDKFINNYRDVVVKVGPLSTAKDIEHLANIGFTKFHCSNTLPTEKGGQSGQILQPYTTKLIDIIRSLNISDVQIIAGGGIFDIHAVKDYIGQGATDISLGTVCFHPLKFIKLLKDINELQNFRS